MPAPDRGLKIFFQAGTVGLHAHDRISAGVELRGKDDPAADAPVGFPDIAGKGQDLPLPDALVIGDPQIESAVLSADERDLFSVRRPAGRKVVQRTPGNIADPGAVGIHHVNFTIAVAVGNEGNASAIRRPAGLIFFPDETGQGKHRSADPVHSINIVGIGKDDLFADRGHIGRIELDRTDAAVARPEILTNEIRGKQRASAGAVTPDCFDDPHGTVRGIPGICTVDQFGGRSGRHRSQSQQTKQ